jgi:hypothetical protein
MLASAEQNLTNGRRCALRLMIYALFSMISSIEELVGCRLFFFDGGWNGCILGVTGSCHVFIIGCLRASVIRRDAAALLLQRFSSSSSSTENHLIQFSSYSSLTKNLFGKLQNLLSSDPLNSSEAAQIKILRYESLPVRHRWALLSGEDEIAAASV